MHTSTTVPTKTTFGMAVDPLSVVNEVLQGKSKPKMRQSGGRNVRASVTHAVLGCTVAKQLKLSSTRRKSERIR